MDGAILYDLFAVYYSWLCSKLVIFVGSKHIGGGVNLCRTQRRRQEPWRATDAAHYFLVAEGGKGDGARVLLRCEVCGADGREIWWRPPVQPLLHSTQTQGLGSLLAMSFDVLDGRWDILFSPNPWNKPGICPSSVLKHVLALLVHRCMNGSPRASICSRYNAWICSLQFSRFQLIGL
jgi:hypothetical protein